MAPETPGSPGQDRVTDSAATWLGNCFACFTEGEPDGCPICGRVSDDE